MTSFQKFFCIVAFAVIAAPAAVLAQTNLFSSTDPLLGIDLDAVPGSNFPGGEAPIFALDGDSTTKYLNFGQQNSGFIIDLPSAVTPQSLLLRSADDAPERDPTSWELYGFNGAVTETNNGRGFADAWVPIASGTDTGLNALVEPARETFGTLQTFTNTTAYDSFRLVFPTVRDAGAANSLQVADVVFFSDAGVTPITTVPTSVIAIDADPFSSASNFPGGESPAQAFDGDITTKYLNFGGANSGVIVTSSSGAVVANQLNLQTADDGGLNETSRNPMTWEVYGTNDPITSGNNSLGDDENWLLLGSGSTGFSDATPPEEPSGDLVFANSTAFTSYRVVFPTVSGSDLFQIGEISLSTVPEPTALGLMGLAFAGLLAFRRRRK